MRYPGFAPLYSKELMIICVIHWTTSAFQDTVTAVDASPLMHTFDLYMDR